jgi:Lsr2
MAAYPAETGENMARKVVTTLICDISGETADETVRFGLDGASYEIDLSEPNAFELRTVLTEYINVARKAGRGAKASVKRSNKSDNQAVRAWAAENGHEVGMRGRLSGELVDAYRAAVAA